MKTVGDTWPEFELQGCISIEPGAEFSLFSHQSSAEDWRVFFFWPMDFTFVCPTEIAEFGRRNGDFQSRKCSVFGVSTDTHYVHLA